MSWTNEKDPGTLTNQVNKISWHVDMFLFTLIRIWSGDVGRSGGGVVEKVVNRNKLGNKHRS